MKHRSINQKTAEEERGLPRLPGEPVSARIVNRDKSDAVRADNPAPIIGIGVSAGISMLRGCGKRE